MLILDFNKSTPIARLIEAVTKILIYNSGIDKPTQKYSKFVKYKQYT